MNRREAMKSLSGIVAACGLTGAVRAVEQPTADEPLPFFALEFDAECSSLSFAEIERIQDKWKALFDGPGPRLVILPLGVKLIGPLPGRYSHTRRIEDVEETVTFQTLEELQDYQRILWGDR